MLRMAVGNAFACTPCRFVLAAAVAACIAIPAQAGVTQIVIDTKVSPAFGGASQGAAGQYEILTGRAFGEIDPDDAKNAVITDIKLAPRNARGQVEYIATFQIVKPIDMTRASGLMWHDVPNRGGRITIGVSERNAGDVGLSSGWQGDNSGGTAYGSAGREHVVVPIARNDDGTPITGRVMGRISNASGPNSQQMIPQSNPLPYRPVTLDTTQATLTEIESETVDGRLGVTHTIAPDNWAWARCDASNPFPGVPDPTQICLKNGFTPNRMYQVEFTAQDPRVLGIGFAAFRDLASFLKDGGNDNPLGDSIRWIIGRGSSQSGRFLRTFLMLGFNEDEQGRQVQDGTWPIIAGGHIWLNTRFAVPDAGLKLYDLAVEGPLWWLPYADKVRKLPTSGILDACNRSRTCPKIIEHNGAAEIWALRLVNGWIGTDGRADLPVPRNVRRYYIPGTPHGGGNGAMSTTPTAPASCPSPAWGTATFSSNPMPHTETVNAIRYHFRRWVMEGVAPPPSRWPTIAGKTLVDPTKAALGFPSIPGVPSTAPTGLIAPVIDYELGPGFDYATASGIQTVVPPVVIQPIRAMAPKVDADGNELGGVPVVLRDAPLGTYLGWNITNGGYYNGMLCSFLGGMIPFARTQAQRLANGDPRLSLEERYGSHDGYVQAVRAAAANAVSQGFLLQPDADALIARAQASNVLNP